VTEEGHGPRPTQENIRFYLKNNQKQRTGAIDSRGSKDKPLSSKPQKHQNTNAHKNTQNLKKKYH
jgi:hypothetical protein